MEENVKDVKEIEGVKEVEGVEKVKKLVGVKKGRKDLTRRIPLWLSDPSLNINSGVYTIKCRMPCQGRVALT